MTNATESNEVIIMEPGDRDWFKDLLKAELDPMKATLSKIPCTEHEQRVTACETKLDSDKDWRTWLLGLGMLILAGLTAYNTLKKG